VAAPTIDSDGLDSAAGVSCASSVALLALEADLARSRRLLALSEGSASFDDPSLAGVVALNRWWSHELAHARKGSRGSRVLVHVPVVVVFG
jgi:hypothetical protein